MIIILEQSKNNASSYKDTFKKKVDPFAHLPSVEEREKSEEARIFLEEASSEHSLFFNGGSIDVLQLEKIFAGNSSKDPYLIIVWLFLRRRDLLKSSRKYISSYMRSVSEGAITTLFRKISINQQM